MSPTNASPTVRLYRQRTDSDLGSHRTRLYGLALEVGARTIIELGVRRGVSTTALLAAAAATDGRVWSCDIKDHDAPPAVRADNRWTFHRGDDLDPRTLAAAPAVCDLLFIDTSHTAAQTAGELAAYGPRVRTDGVIVMHDADPADGQDVMGPALEYARANHLTLTYYPGSHGLAVIR